MATKHVVVYVDEDDGRVYVRPAKVRLKGGRDTVQLFNDTDVEVEWDVPKGAFTPSGRFKGKVKAKKDKSSPPALEQEEATHYTYTVTEVRLRRGKKRRRKARGNSDPVIIIDL